jgi:DHA1 family inner membrane transport protein
VFAPVRALLAPRSGAAPGVLAAAAVVALSFVSTPFLVVELADQLEISLGRAGLLSTFQVAGFAATSFLAGRLLRPRARLHRASLVGVAVAGLLSALSPGLVWMLAFQLVAGIGLGLLTWLSWAEATRHRAGLSDVAAIGPLTTVVGAPVLAGVGSVAGYQGIFLLQAGLAVATLWIDAHYGELPVIGRNVSDSRTNRILLLALFGMTMSGSAIFVFAAAAGTEVAHLSRSTVSIAFSLNALVGVVANRFAARRGTAGLWLLAGSVAAVAIGTVRAGSVYMVAMTAWGFVWWMGIPAVFRLLADRSLTPAERVGDAQSLMALGRVFGPLVGGTILGHGNFGRLSIVAALGLVMASLLVLVVEVARLRIDRQLPA